MCWCAVLTTCCPVCAVSAVAVIKEKVVSLSEVAVVEGVESMETDS